MVHIENLSVNLFSKIIMAEGKGFEPLESYSNSHSYQPGALDHSANPPLYLNKDIIKLYIQFKVNLGFN